MPGWFGDFSELSSLYKLENFELTLINKLSNLSHNLQPNETRLTNYSLIKRIHENYNDY